MFNDMNPVLWLVGTLGLLAVILAVRRHFSAEARERRRRGRSHGPVVSSKRGPTVRLAVDVEPSKRKERR